MEATHALWVLLIGIAVVLAALVSNLAQRMAIPAVVGYLAMGVLIGTADAEWALLGSRGREVFGLLGDLGIVVLLFRVGLESNLKGLIAKLGSASRVWLGDVVVSGGFAFLAAYYLAGLTLVPSFLVAVAFTATSVGVSVAVWESRQALDSPNGRLLLDVAELDDISAVVLMALLFSLLPVIGTGGDLVGPLLAASGLFVVKFALFAGFCILFARYLEEPLSQLIASLKYAPQRMLTVAGVGLVIAALAGLIGFSLAIGALFAGLLFSRDPEAVKTEARFGDLYAFFMPFFFIGIGLQVNLAVLGEAAGLGMILLVAAVAGKMLGAGLPARLVTRSKGAMLIAVSMVPRAEISLVIAYQGRQAGFVTEDIYAALVLVSAVTCVAAPWVVHDLLGRWPQVVAKTGSRT